MKNYRNSLSLAAVFAACLCSPSGASSPPHYQPVNCSVEDISENNGNLWPGGIVKYELDHTTLSKRDVHLIRAAKTEIESRTCIRFQHRSENDTSYTVFGTDNSICGDATVCRQQSPSYTRFGGQCRDKRTMVHELGHTLCLSHESLQNAQKDRSMYNFWSHMTSQNAIGNKNVWYHQFLAQRTQWHNDTVFSVMDVDKINSLYNCQGCYSHRWKFINELSDEDKKYMIRFGRTLDGKPLYACRGYVNGELCVGKYRADEEKCYLSWGGMEFFHTEWAQVYLDPAWVKGEVPSKGIYDPDQDISSDHFVEVLHANVVIQTNDGYEKPTSEENAKLRESLIPVGMRFWNGNAWQTAFLIVGEVGAKVNGTREVAIGKLWEHELNGHLEGQFPVDGKEENYFSYKILRCNEKTINSSRR